VKGFAVCLVSAAALFATEGASAAISRAPIDIQELGNMRQAAPHAVELFEQGEAAGVAGDLEGAHQLFQRATSEASWFSLAHRRDCEALSALGKREQAVDECSKALEDRRIPLNARALIRALVGGAAYLFCNEYEEALIERKSGWSGAEVLARVGVRVTTLGPAGARVERAGESPLIVGPVQETSKTDPTGTGDAFRAGFLAAVGKGLSLERAAQLGNLLAVCVLETVGTQEYELKPSAITERITDSYGPEAAADLTWHYG